MGRMGFDKTSGFAYEGRSDPVYPIWPNPVLSQATLIETPLDIRKIPPSFESSPFGWMFREDSFDPVSRIRRGRLFQKFSNAGWEDVLVEVHPAIKSDELLARNHGGRLRKELSTFIECTNLLQSPRQGEGLHLALGVASSYSLWRIVQTERTANQDVLVTLRAESTFDILPALDLAAIAPESHSSVIAALERVLDAAYKELPTSIVDQCRNAATVVVSRWMRQQTNSERQIEQDLGDWIKVIDLHFKELKRPRVALCSALDVIRLLHPRGKDNELARLELRPISNEDATLAVHILGFVLREVGWSKD